MPCCCSVFCMLWRWRWRSQSSLCWPVHFSATTCSPAGKVEFIFLEAALEKLIVGLKMLLVFSSPIGKQLDIKKSSYKKVFMSDFATFNIGWVVTSAHCFFSDSCPSFCRPCNSSISLSKWKSWPRVWRALWRWTGKIQSESSLAST